MSKKKFAGAAFGVALIAGGLVAQAPSIALADTVLSIDKTSSLAQAMVGDVVEFTIRVTGNPGERFQITDQVADYLGHSTASPAIANVAPLGDGVTLNIVFDGSALNVTGLIGDAGTYTLTYSVLVESVGDAALSSETCVAGAPLPTQPPTRPTEASIMVAPASDSPDAVEQEASELEVSEQSATPAAVELPPESVSTPMAEEVPVAASNIDVYDASGNCVSVVVPIVVPEPPIEPEPEPQVDEPPVAVNEVTAPTASGAKTLANTGSAGNTNAAVGIAAVFAAAGGGLLALRRKLNRREVE